MLRPASDAIIRIMILGLRTAFRPTWPAEVGRPSVGTWTVGAENNYFYKKLLIGTERPRAAGQKPELEVPADLAGTGRMPPGAARSIWRHRVF